MKPEKKLEKKIEFYKDLTKWLEAHDNQFPLSYVLKDGKRIEKADLDEKQTQQVLLGGRWYKYRKEDAKLLSSFFNEEEENIPEQYRVVVRAIKLNPKTKREIELSAVSNVSEQMDLGKATASKRKLIEKMMQANAWLKENKRFPKLKAKDDSSEEGKKEYKIYTITKHPDIVKLADPINGEYSHTPIEDVPVEYQDYIAIVREITQKESVFTPILEWLRKHDGELPRSAIFEENSTKKTPRKRISRQKLSDELLAEVRLRQSWDKSKERKWLEDLVGIPITDIPIVYQDFVNQMREFKYGIKEEDCFPEVIKWLNEHKDSLPRTRVDKPISKKAKEEEEDLRRRWDKSPEKAALDKYLGIPVEKIQGIPEELKKRIALLRTYEFGLTEEELEDRVMEWIDNHDGELPHQTFEIDGKKVRKIEFLNLEQYREYKLACRWYDSKLRKLLMDNIGKPISGVPIEYQERIQRLRGYGLEKEPREYVDPFNEIVEWLKTHDGRYPTTVFRKPDKSVKKFSEMTPEEIYEISLSHRWFNSATRKAIYRYLKEKTELDQIPEEYKEKVRVLRENTKKHKRTKKSEERRKAFFDEFIKWLDTHNNRTPRASISRNNKPLKVAELTPEQQYEVDLYNRWNTSGERKALDACFGKPETEAPLEYQEKIKILRAHGQMGRSPEERAKNKMRAAVRLQTVAHHAEVRAELNRNTLKELPQQNAATIKADGETEFELSELE